MLVDASGVTLLVPRAKATIVRQEKVDYNYRYAISLAIFIYCFGIGIQQAILSVSWLDLSEHLAASQQDMSYVLTAMHLVAGVGAISTSLIYTASNRQTLFSSLLLSTIPLFTSFPLLTQISSLYVMACFWALILGTISATGKSWLLEMWGAKVGPFLQCYHLSYSVGSVIGPLLCNPFLSDTSSSLVSPSSTERSADSFNKPLEGGEVAGPFSGKSGNDVANSTSGFHEGDALLVVPYAVGSCFYLLSGGVMIYLQTKRLNRAAPSPDDFSTEKLIEKAKLKSDAEGMNGSLHSLANGKGRHSPGHPPSHMSGHVSKNGQLVNLPQGGALDLRTRFLVTAAAILLIVFYGGVASPVFSFLPVFVVATGLGMTKSTGSYMRSVFAASVLVGRLVSIGLSIKLRAHVMLTANYVLLAISLVILLLFGRTSPAMIWIGFVVFGAAVSSIYGAIITYCGERVPISNFVIGVFIVGHDVLNCFLPILIGQYIESHPMILVYVVAVCSVAEIVTFYFLHRAFGDMGLAGHERTRTVPQVKNA